MKSIDLPIGLALSQTAKAVTRGFEDCLNHAGGALSTWLILQVLIAQNGELQAALAQKIGVQGSTLTHHLNGLETAGLITRTRLITDRRSHRVDITDQGRDVYQRLRQSAMTYDAMLNAALSASEAAIFRGLLARMALASKASLDGDTTR
jgi:MarR family transcriptional regulator, transcriptional regulator for hemolysin